MCRGAIVLLVLWSRQLSSLSVLFVIARRQVCSTLAQGAPLTVSDTRLQLATPSLQRAAPPPIQCLDSENWSLLFERGSGNAIEELGNGVGAQHDALQVFVLEWHSSRTSSLWALMQICVRTRSNTRMHIRDAYAYVCAYTYS